MSQAANAYLENTIARFRKVLSPSVVPINLPKEIATPPTTRKPHPKAVLSSSKDVRKLSSVSKRLNYFRDVTEDNDSKRTNTLQDVQKSFDHNGSATPQRDKESFKRSKLTVYPCGPTSERWNPCAVDCAHIRKRPHGHNCHCSECKQAECPWRGPGRPAEGPGCSAGVVGPPPGARANIATFVDTSTMTPQPADASTSPPAQPQPPARLDLREDCPMCQGNVQYQFGANRHVCQRPRLTLEDEARRLVTFMQTSCPTCLQAVMTPVYDNDEYELVSMRRKDCYFGVSVSPNIGPTVMPPPLRPPPRAPRSTSSTSYRQPVVATRPYEGSPTDFRATRGARQRSLSPGMKHRQPPQYSGAAGRPPRHVSRYHENCYEAEAPNTTTAKLPPKPRWRPVASSRTCCDPCRGPCSPGE